MRLFRSKQDADLEQAISELRAQEPDAKTLSGSAQRVWQRLQTGQGAISAVQVIRGCADIRSLLPAFHRQELPQARALIVRDHLRECASCRSYASGRGVDGAATLGWQMEPGARGSQRSLVRMPLAAAAVAVRGILTKLRWEPRAPGSIER